MIDKLKLHLFLILLSKTIIVESMPRTLNPNDLQELKYAIHEASAIMEKEAKNEDVVICIGSPRSGKSTLINYLIGNELIGVRISKGKPVTIVKADNSPGPVIGSGSTSKTTFPSRWTSINFPEMSLWDAPGFDDNRGPVQDITNAVYIYQLLEKVKSLKIVLVMDINDIFHDNIHPFLSVLNAVENIFKDEMRRYFRSMSVIFSKVPNTLHDTQVDMGFIKDLLREKVLSTTEMEVSENLRDFVQFLIFNDQHIGLFKKAELGPITSAIDLNILQAIKHSKSTEKTILTQLSPSISDGSMIYLYEARESLSSTSSFIRLQEIVSEILDFLINKAEQHENGGDSLNNLNAIYNDLRNIKLQIHETFNASLNFHQKVEILQSIDPAIASHIKQEKLLEKAKLMEIIDKLLELKESNVFDINLQSITDLSLVKINELMISISVKLGKITQQQSEDLMENERIRHYEEQEKLRNYLLQLEKLNEERRKSLFEIFSNFLKIAVTKVATWFITKGTGVS